jgi:CheY-like chemotaxis protein
MTAEISGNPNKIIIGVDDVPESLMFLKMNLLAGGYAFVGVKSGEECLRLVETVAPALILLDIQMTGMDGFETCRRLRQMNNAKEAPIVFLTGRRSEADLRACVAAGGNDFIVKPVTQKTLLERAGHWTNRRVDRGKIIIGVDDAVESLTFLEMNLTAAGFTFLGAKSGQECLQLVERVTPSLILLDIQMPEMDGFETCRRLREMPKAKNTPIVFLTGRKSEADVRAGMAVGGTDFIAKPFSRRNLVERALHWADRQIERSEIVIAVDDSPETLLLLKKSVVAAGYSFFGVTGGAECLRLVQSMVPAIIFLQARTRGEDGFETCRLLRDTPNAARTPIVLLTSGKTDADTQLCAAVGGSDFLVKPFTERNLLENIRRWVGRDAAPAQPDPANAAAPEAPPAPAASAG